ncbi:MAG: HD domain-containing protein [Lachnospiraceae bacterium]|nr:HD domain-containing protein [Lachnospiraceae bacterium]
MSKLVSINELEGGEVLAADVITNDYQVLLSVGTILKLDYVEKLKELDIDQVRIQTENSEECAILKEEVKETCLNKVKDVLGRHTYNNNSELMEINSAAEDVIQNILEDEQAVEAVYEIKERTPDIYEHSLTVCSMAILTGLRLGLSRDVINDIGTASLLHDLGLRYITVNYINTDISSLNEKEQEEYRKHTVYGYTAVLHEQWISERAKRILLFHHEKKGGLGYPLHATDIPVECQVLGICETFDELICGIGYVAHKVPEAIEFIKATKGNLFDEEVTNAFFQFIAAYPFNTLIKLSDGSEGIVIKQNKGFPERPVIKLTKDSSGNTCNTETIVDLVKVHNVVIECIL